MSSIRALEKQALRFAERVGGSVVPLKYLFERVKTPAAGTEELLSLYRDYGVIPKRSREDNFNRASDDLSKYQVVEPGYLVVNKMKAWQGSVAISNYEGIVSPAYFVYKPHSDTPIRYLHYALRSNTYRQAFGSLSYGVRPNQWDLEPGAFARLPVALPPSDTAGAIADYLDHETAEIDAFISDTKILTEIEAERASAQFAIWLTKGVDTGNELTSKHLVDWLYGAEVPAHWQSVKLGLVVDLRSGDGITSSEIEEAGDYRVYGGGGFRGYTSTWTHQGDQVMFGRQGALCGQVFVGQGPLYATEHAVVVRPKVPTDPKWLESMLRFMNLGQYSTSAAQPGLSVDDISKLRIVQPPLDEQRVIGERIATYERTINSTKEDLTRALDLARERRAALISAAVTGQIDVTNGHKPVAEVLEDKVRERA